MNYQKLVSKWISHHNEKYFQYITGYDEPRYSVKSFFFQSYKLLKLLGSPWQGYLEKYSDLFCRDPNNDFYGKRDPISSRDNRQTALEWATAFEIVSEVGFPHNQSAKLKFLKYSKSGLDSAMRSPDNQWVDFMLSSAVAHLPEEYPEVKEWLPSKMEEYIQNSSSAHQLIAYLKAARNFEHKQSVKATALAKLCIWINNPKETPEKQILMWARLITSLSWLEHEGVTLDNKEIFTKFLTVFQSIYDVEWSNLPLALQAFFICADEPTKETIKTEIEQSLCPSSFFSIREIVPFLKSDDEALEITTAETSFKEKCKQAVTKNECLNCMVNKQSDCWIRIISKVTNTPPQLHSGYEVADSVTYSLDRGIYIVVKAEPITNRTNGGDVLFHQCVKLFSKDNALILYLNPKETAPFIIEEIRTAAATSTKKPRFEVIDQKFIRQILRRYISP